MKIKELAVSMLVVSLGFGALPAIAQDAISVVRRGDLEQAMALKVRSDEGARDIIRTLLAREEVKALAGEMGVDVRLASNAVSSLQGAELQRVADPAAAVNDMMAGGTTIQISLVAILLIVIIIILLAN
jgi:hypothetical protein